jgi:hypothetical protein
MYHVYASIDMFGVLYIRCYCMYGYAKMQKHIRLFTHQAQRCMWWPMVGWVGKNRHTHRS